jgi:hypothetical protein
VGIKVNDDIGPYFRTKRGLRQGDPMSPILFNIVADMLALIIKRVEVDGQISDVIPHSVALMMTYQFYNMSMKLASSWIMI